MVLILLLWGFAAIFKDTHRTTLYKRGLCAFCREGPFIPKAQLLFLHNAALGHNASVMKQTRAQVGRPNLPDHYIDLSRYSSWAAIIVEAWSESL